MSEPKKRGRKSPQTDAQDEFLADLLKIVPKSDTSGMGGLEIVRSRDSILSQVKYVLTTGIRPFDDFIGGFPFGRVCEVFGTENCGKTNLMLRCALRASQFHIVQLDKQPDGSVLRHNINPEESQVFVLYIDNEQSFDDDNKIVIDGQRIDAMVARSDTIDMMFKLIERALDHVNGLQTGYDEKGINKKVFLVVIVDTIASTTSRQELEQEWGTDDYPRQAGQISKGFRKIVRDVNRNNAVLICTNQIRENMKSGAAASRRTGPVPVDVEYTTFGGRALRFYASQRIFMENLHRSYRLGESQFENGLVIGFSAVKNRIKSPLRHGRMVLFLDMERGGLNNLYSILETLIFTKHAEQERSIIRFRFSWSGVTTTTFGGSTSTTLAEDDEEDPAETPSGRGAKRGRRDPFIENRTDWPDFYTAHRADLDALWAVAVQTAFQTNGNIGRPESAEVENA